MRCRSCASPILEGADYCVECGAAVAATGGTVVLNRSGMPIGVSPSSELPVHESAPNLRKRRRRSLFDGSWMPLARSLNARSGALMLIGLGVLFFTGTFWPWIIALIGIAGALEEFATGTVREGAMTLTMLVGVAVLFATGLFWPGIFILAGLVALIEWAPG